MLIVCLWILNSDFVVVIDVVLHQQQEQQQEDEEMEVPNSDNPEGPLPMDGIIRAWLRITHGSFLCWVMMNWSWSWCMLLMMMMMLISAVDESECRNSFSNSLFDAISISVYLYIPEWVKGSSEWRDEFAWTLFFWNCERVRKRWFNLLWLYIYIYIYIYIKQSWWLWQCRLHVLGFGFLEGGRIVHVVCKCKSCFDKWIWNEALLEC